jgi:hypothetical protein
MDVDREPVDLGVVEQQRQPNKERITTRYLTKYERARILGTRALQIRCVLQWLLKFVATWPLMFCLLGPA